MTRAEEILLKEMRNIASISNGQVKRLAAGALIVASNYLATEQKQREKFMEEQPDGTIHQVWPTDARAELIADLRGLIDLHTWAHVVVSRAVSMLEADAQQAKRVPMTAEQITEMATQEQFLLVCDGLEELTQIVRATEQHHDITPTDKGTHILRTPTDWSAA